MSPAQWDALDPGDYQKMVDKQVRRQLRFQLFAYSAFYRALFEKDGVSVEELDGAADLQKMRLVRREDLSSAPEDFILRPSRGLIQKWGSGRQLTAVAVDKVLRGIEGADKNLGNEYEPVHLLETAGTTAEPIPIRMSRRDLSVVATQGRRSLEIAGLGEPAVILNLLEPSSAGGFWAFWLGGVAMGAEQLAPGFLEPAQYAALARKVGATVLIGRAEDVLQTLEAQPEGIPSLQRIILGPGPASDTLRARIQAAAGSDVRVVSSYYFAEGRSAWVECAEGAGKDAGFHTYPDFDLFETVSLKDGSVLRQAEPGEVAYTGLDQRGTAVARYLPGDVSMGGLRKGRCPYCGRVCDRLVGPIRRTDEIVPIQLPGSDRGFLDKQVVSEILSRPDVASWQLEVSKVDDDPRAGDEVVVLFDSERSLAPEIARRLEEAFSKSAGFTPTQFVFSRRGERRIVDLRPRT